MNLKGTPRDSECRNGKRDIYEVFDYNWGLALSTEITWKKGKM